MAHIPAHKQRPGAIVSHQGRSILRLRGRGEPYPSNPHAPLPQREHEEHRLRLRRQHLDRRPSRRQRPRRLTSFPGEASNPKLSPDGSKVAFNAQYAGNVDVYVVPAEGGEPKRLTFHPGADLVQGWTPDGKQVVFASGRASNGPGAIPRFYTVGLDGSVETAMPQPRAYQGKISPDGKRLAYRMNNTLGRRAPQLPRRPESSDLDRRPDDARSRTHAVD